MWGALRATFTEKKGPQIRPHEQFGAARGRRTPASPGIFVTLTLLLGRDLDQDADADRSQTSGEW